MKNTKKSFGEIWSELNDEQTEYLKEYINKQMRDAVEHYKIEQLRLHGVSKSLNTEHNATSVEYAEAIIDMHKNPENSNRDFKIVVIENTIDKLRQDLANI